MTLLLLLSTLVAECMILVGLHQYTVTLEDLQARLGKL